MKQYVLIDTATGKRLHSNMEILTSKTAMILVARLAANGITATISVWNNNNDHGLYARQEGFLWAERA